MAESLWRRLVSLRNVRVGGAATGSASIGALSPGHGLGSVHRSVDGGGTQSFFTGGKTAKGPMMTDATTPSLGQTVLNFVKADLSSTAAVPVVTLLTNLKTHAGNRLMQAADVLQFVNTAPGAGLTLEAELEQQFLGLAIEWIQAKTTAAPAT